MRRGFGSSEGLGREAPLDELGAVAERLLDREQNAVGGALRDAVQADPRPAVELDRQDPDPGVRLLERRRDRVAGRGCA